MTLNFVDAIAVLIIVLAIYFGWRSGFIIQSLALLGFIAGVGLVVVLGPFLAERLVDVDPWLRSVIVIALVAGTVLVAQGVGSAAGAALRRRVGRGVLGGLDQGVGGAFGFVRGIFLVWLMGGLLAVLPMPQLATEARQSTVLRTLETRLPSPVILAAELGRLIEQTGLPQVIVGAPPPADAPGTTITTAQAEQIAAGARSSTVRVESIACGNFVSGTGFAVSADHFVTNAHVVAGSSQLWISFNGAFERYPAHVVMFDPQLDAALVAVGRTLNVHPLALSSQIPSRGAAAAALGFTGGGGQRLIPAVVSRSIEALGRDIYGSRIVARQVIEMRADVAPGDSGGPVLLADGTVGGVTFSESRDSADIGYALSPLDVASAIASAENNTTPVPTGDCIR